MNQELRDPKVKVWPTSRIIVVSVIYVALATLAAIASIKVAIPRVQDMGHYQVQKTREFLGREKAKEMENYMQGKSAANEGEAPGESTPQAPALDSAD